MPRKPIENERRNERISLILTPSLLDGIKNLADSQGLSVNELVTGVMADVVKQNARVIADFKAARDMATKSFIKPAADIPTPAAQGTE